MISSDDSNAEYIKFRAYIKARESGGFGFPRNWPSLEAKARTEFNHAGISRRGDDAEVRRSERVPRSAEICVIECVVKGTPKFQSDSFRDDEVLLKVDVKIDVTGIGQAVGAEHPECPFGILSKSGRVEPVCNLVSPRSVVGVVASDDIRGILSDSGKGVVKTGIQAEWSA